jgi:hypothetical protein
MAVRRATKSVKGTRKVKSLATKALEDRRSKSVKGGGDKKANSGRVHLSDLSVMKVTDKTAP